MKDTDEHLYSWPTMHRYAQMQFSLRKRRIEGEYAAVSPLSMSMSNCLTCVGLDSRSSVLEKNKAGGKIY